MRQLLLNRIVWLQSLTVLAILIPLTFFGVYAWSKHKHVEVMLANLEPRYARLLGLLEKSKELQATAGMAKEQLDRLVYPASQDATQAGNDAQQRIRTLFADSKLDIISIQVLPTKEEGQLNRVTIDLRVEGDLVGIHNAFSMLSSQKPMVFVDDLSIQTIGAVRPASSQRLAGQFIFSILRVLP